MSKIITLSRSRKADLVAAVAFETGNTQKLVAMVLDEVMAQIEKRVMGGDRVILAGFGSFFLRETGGFKRHLGEVPMSRRMSFIPAKSIRKVI